MGEWTIVFLFLLAMVAMVVLPLAAVVVSYWRSSWRVPGPRTGVTAYVEVRALPAATRQTLGFGGDVPLPADRRPTILVPLDGTPGSESVLPTVRALAQAQDARVRLLRVIPCASPLRDDGDRVIWYADPATARVEDEGLAYLDRVAAGLAGLEVEARVRFGDPAAEILGASDARDVSWVAMATRPHSWLGRVLGRSVTDRVERRAWVPVIRTPYRVIA